MRAGGRGVIARECQSALSSPGRMASRTGSIQPSRQVQVGGPRRPAMANCVGPHLTGGQKRQPDSRVEEEQEEECPGRQPASQAAQD